MPNNNETIQAMLEKFLPFAQERMGFKNVPNIRLESDEDNAQQPLGKTAYYDPSNSAVTVYVSGRHPKDIMRSISHELVHHTQNGRGEFEKVGAVGEGYAQNDDHLREMEREAYEQGNLCFRDWEDSIKPSLEEGALDWLKQKAKEEAELEKSVGDAHEEDLLKYQREKATSGADYIDTLMKSKSGPSAHDEMTDALSNVLGDYKDMLEYSAGCDIQAKEGKPCGGDPSIGKWDIDFKKYVEKRNLVKATMEEELNMFEKRNKKLNEGIMKKFGYVNEASYEDLAASAETEGDRKYASEFAPNPPSYDEFFAEIGLTDAEGREVVDAIAEEDVDALEASTAYDKLYSVYENEFSQEIDVNAGEDVASWIMNRLASGEEVSENKEVSGLDESRANQIMGAFGVSEDATLQLMRVMQAYNSGLEDKAAQMVEDEFVINNALRQRYHECDNDPSEAIDCLVKELYNEFGTDLAMAGWTMEEDLERYVGDEPRGACKDLEKALVAGEQGGIADCPEARDTLAEPEDEEEDPMPMDDVETLPEATGFNKDFGDEFDHIFEDHDDDDDDEASDIDECMMELPVEEEEETEIIVKVNEGLFDNRDKLLFEKLLKWSSK